MINSCYNIDERHNMIENLYYCEHCREQIVDLKDIQFVEENSDRGFCSEKCIMDFYRPYMLGLEKEEYEFRKKLKLGQEDEYLDIIGNNHYLELALNQPHEVWHLENDLGQSFYTHILKVKSNDLDVFFILICTHVDDSPSFVFYRLATSFKQLVHYYRRQKPIDSETIQEGEEPLDFEVPSEVLESLEGKKSVLLAEMMQVRSDHDIPFEQFLEFNQFLDSTMEDPDEIYEYEDMEGDLIHVLIKSYKKMETSFFYIVIAMPYRLDQTNHLALLPILGFPSIDENLYPNYTKGVKLNSTLKN